MRSTASLAIVIAIALSSATPSRAQDREGLMGDFIRDVEQVEKKIVDLARAMPAEAFAWRPGDGVRSTSETLMHVAADNYLLPAVMGIAPPAGTDINGKDYKTALAFEKRTVTRDQAIAELEKSFAFLRTSMKGFPDEKFEAPLKVFGQEMTHRRLWVMTVTHLHEHLGQLIAYARSNSVVPPWSR